MKRFSVFESAVLSSVLCLAAVGCGYTENKTAGSQPGTLPPGAAAPTPPDPGATPAGSLATFSQVSLQILQPSCVSCHSAGAQAPDLSSYAGFATNTAYVVPGDPSGSLLYTEVQSGAMPKGGAPLTQAQQNLLSDWITQGALNN